jgi:uncharacterized surface protein with fasciclin (FAS1) repeats
MSLKSLKLIAAVGLSSLAMAAANAAENLVGVAAANPQFSTLVTAVKAAGLVETLSGKGPFTIFAPTNAAFDKLPPGTVDALLKDPAKLKAILTYHVVAGNVMAKDVKPGATKTVNGASMMIAAKDGGVMVDGAKVTATDVKASNGVIHVIDTVIMPK